MHEVEVSETTHTPPKSLRERLSPRTIVECTGIFDVEAHEMRGDTEVFVVDVNGVEMTLAFSAVENGYEYRVTDDSGLFRERRSRVTVEGEREGETRVHAKTTYTLDSVWAFLLDRMAAKRVKGELEILVENFLETTTAEPPDERDSPDEHESTVARTDTESSEEGVRTDTEPGDKGERTDSVEPSGGDSPSSQNSSSG